MPNLKKKTQTIIERTFRRFIATRPALDRHTIQAWKSWRARPVTIIFLFALIMASAGAIMTFSATINYFVYRGEFVAEGLAYQRVVADYLVSLLKPGILAAAAIISSVMWALFLDRKFDLAIARILAQEGRCIYCGHPLTSVSRNCFECGSPN